MRHLSGASDKSLNIVVLEKSALLFQSTKVASTMRRRPPHLIDMSARDRKVLESLIRDGHGVLPLTGGLDT